MARLLHIVLFVDTGIAGEAARALISRWLATPGTLAFLASTR